MCSVHAVRTVIRPRTMLTTTTFRLFQSASVWDNSSFYLYIFYSTLFFFYTVFIAFEEATAFTKSDLNNSKNLRLKITREEEQKKKNENELHSD